MHPMFTAAVFTIDKIWKQSKCPPTDEWIKMWWVCVFIHTHTHIYICNGIRFSHKKE